MNLLIIDDDLTFLSLAKTILERENHSIRCCTTLNEARSIINKEKINLILLDHHLENENTLPFLEEIRKDHLPTEIAVIVITNNDSQDLIIKTLKSGANDYILKPINVQILRARVNNQLTFLNLYNDSLKAKEMETLNHFILDSNEKLKNSLEATKGSVKSLKSEGLNDKNSLALKNKLHEISKTIDDIGEHARSNSITYNFSSTGEKT